MKVEFKNIHKYFGKVHANDGIDLTIPSGAIQGIVGENGAGKSTLMKILSGFYLSDQGEIWLDDKSVVINSPADAIGLGIGMLHQDPLDFPPMRVIDNLIINNEKGVFPDRKACRRKLLDLADAFGFKINPEDHVEDLSVGERQQLEILRLMMLGAKVLIFDEPTTGISALQKEKLFNTLKKLPAEGMTVLFVSHKLEEIQSICDRVAVLKDGKLVGTASAPFNLNNLVKMMFGKEIKLPERGDVRQDDHVLSVNNLQIEDSRIIINGVNLQVRRGEVIGLAGMEGSGQGLFLQACCGLKRPLAGSQVLVNGVDMTKKSYHAYLHQGVAYVPADRLTDGLIPGLSLFEHFALAKVKSGFVINRSKIMKLTKSKIEDYRIRGTAKNKIEALSGGNQQRALMALLKEDIQLLLVEHPARGLDIESTIWIWNTLKERCKNGTSILFISSDLEQILHYSDRVMVFFGGRVSHPMDTKNTTIDQLGQLIGGRGFDARD